MSRSIVLWSGIFYLFPIKIIIDPLPFRKWLFGFNSWRLLDPEATMRARLRLRCQPLADRANPVRNEWTPAFFGL